MVNTYSFALKRKIINLLQYILLEYADLFSIKSLVLINDDF